MGTKGIGYIAPFSTDTGLAQASPCGASGTASRQRATGKLSHTRAEPSRAVLVKGLRIGTREANRDRAVPPAAVCPHPRAPAGLSRFFRDLTRFVRQQPRPTVPEVVLNNVKVLHHNSRLCPSLPVILGLPLRLLNWPCQIVRFGADVVCARFYQLILAACFSPPCRVKSDWGYPGEDSRPEKQHCPSCISRVRCCN